MKMAIGVALTGLALLASGCAGDSRAQTGDRTGDRTGVPASPGDGDALVLRTMTTGGIAGLGGPGAMPEFSLYGDGRAIIGGPHPMEYHLTGAAVRRLVAEAQRAGLATPRTVDDRNIADATYKVITFVTGGRARTTKIIQEGGDPSDPARRFLPRLAPSGWPRSDQPAPAKAYRPARVAVLAGVAPAGGAAPEWPLGRLTSGTRVGTRECTVLTGGDAAKAQRLTTPGQWRDHGTTYRVVVRPLLPDEHDCGALNHRA